MNSIVCVGISRIETPCILALRSSILLNDYMELNLKEKLGKLLDFHERMIPDFVYTYSIDCFYLYYGVDSLCQTVSFVLSKEEANTSEILPLLSAIYDEVVFQSQSVSDMVCTGIPALEFLNEGDLNDCMSASFVGCLRSGEQFIKNVQSRSRIRHLVKQSQNIQDVLRDTADELAQQTEHAENLALRAADLGYGSCNFSLDADELTRTVGRRWWEILIFRIIGEPGSKRRKLFYCLLVILILFYYFF